MSGSGNNDDERRANGTSSDKSSSKTSRPTPYKPLPRVFMIHDRPDGPIDEICLTICTQHVNKRLNGLLPVCHTQCVRRVFKHEVEAILAAAQQQQQHQQQDPLASGSIPPELRLPPAFESEEISDGNALFLERTSDRFGTVSGESVKPVLSDNPDMGQAGSMVNSTNNGPFWREGYYVWKGQGPLATNFKLNQMQIPLVKQEEHRQRFEEHWSVAGIKRARDQQAAAAGSTFSAPQDDAQTSNADASSSTPPPPQTTPPPRKQSNGPPSNAYSSSTWSSSSQTPSQPQGIRRTVMNWFKQSTDHVTPRLGPQPYQPSHQWPHLATLIPLPESPLQALRQEIVRRWQIVSAPTEKLYKLVWDSYANGQQSRVRQSIWAHVQGGGVGKFLNDIVEMGENIEAREREEKARSDKKDENDSSSSNGPSSSS